MNKSVLITGVSSGVGRALAEKFLSRGFQVLGSVRSTEKAAELTAQLGRNFVPLVFDICNESQLEASRLTIEQALGGQQLNALVNNAGSAEMGPLLYAPLDSVKQQLDTLVVGQLAVIQKFYRFLLPQNGQGEAGRIINVSSVSGVNGNPFFGTYCAGKHAIEGLSKSLRKELELFGIAVLVIAPGNIRTSIWQKQTSELVEKYKDTEYHDALRGLRRTITETIVANAMSPEEFAQAFWEIFKLPQPALRYTVTKAKKSRLPFAQPKVTWMED